MLVEGIRVEALSVVLGFRSTPLLSKSFIPFVLKGDIG